MLNLSFQECQHRRDNRLGNYLHTKIKASFAYLNPPWTAPTAYSKMGRDLREKENHKLMTSHGKISNMYRKDKQFLIVVVPINRASSNNLFNVLFLKYNQGQSNYK